MKQILDHVSGHTVSIAIINTGRGGTITICANGVLLTETVRGDAWSMAKCAYAKRDLESFGSFFERAEQREAA